MGLAQLIAAPPPAGYGRLSHTQRRRPAAITTNMIACELWSSSWIFAKVFDLSSYGRSSESSLVALSSTRSML